mmetsp:Transcript_9465/g.28488  ORF Transcript_9465/g.28488 Transcript_9465/m.28488 type:complete len:230 (+) Transcript_9465:311-1000(+)
MTVPRLSSLAMPTWCSWAALACTPPSWRTRLSLWWLRSTRTASGPATTAWPPWTPPSAPPASPSRACAARAPATPATCAPPAGRFPWVASSRPVPSPLWLATRASPPMPPPSPRCSAPSALPRAWTRVRKLFPPCALAVARLPATTHPSTGTTPVRCGASWRVLGMSPSSSTPSSPTTARVARWQSRGPQSPPPPSSCCAPPAAAPTPKSSSPAPSAALRPGRYQALRP